MQTNGQQNCVYCGEAHASTNDHVPPKCLFPKPRPSNLVTVPACEACNRRASLDEEYFLAALMLTDAGISSAGQKLWKTLRRTYDHANGLRARIASAISPAPVFSRGGIFLGNRLTVRHEDERFRSVVTKIVKGLYWLEYGERMPDMSVIHYRFLIAGEEKAVARKYLPHTKVPKHSWPGIFEYRSNRTAEAPAGSIWLLLFFGQMQFWIVASSANVAPQSPEG